jgi:two-component system, NarL family, response regulator NreC
VLIADDHAVFRTALKFLIDAQSDMKVVAEAADGPETVSRARDVNSDVILLDLTMPGAPGTAIMERLLRLDPKPRVLVLTGHDDPAYMRSALQAGVSGYIVKTGTAVELLTAIRAVYHGRTFVDLTRPGEEARGHEVRHVARDSPAARRPRPLSRREAEVLRLLARGHTNQEAADHLAVSVKTIETHRKRLSDKLGLKSRAQLFRFAVEAGLLEADAAQPEDE